MATNNIDDKEFSLFNREYVDKLETESSAYNIFNYIRIPNFIQNLMGHTQSENKNEQLNITNDISANAFSLLFGIKKSLADPLAILITTIIGLFIYIYFANEFMCQALGLFYPCYHTYALLHYNIQDKADKIKSMMRYFIIYGHIELLMAIAKLFDMYFYHLKILVILILLYMTHYRFSILDYLYQKLIFYDKILVGLFGSAILKLHIESTKISTELENKNKKLQ